MKIAMIHGQNHKGSTYHLGHIFTDNIPDAQIEEFFLPRDLEHFCLGCYSCVEDESKCPYYEEKRRIMEKVEEADLLVFTTPTYCSHASAGMKTFIDLTFTYFMIHKPRKVMFSKKAVVFSTASGAGTKSAMKDITHALFYWGVPYIKTYGRSIAAMNWEGVKPQKKAKMEADIKKLANKVSRAKVRVGLKTKGLFMLMRMLQLKNMAAGEKEKAYWNDQGWLGKERPWK